VAGAAGAASAAAAGSTGGGDTASSAPLRGRNVLGEVGRSTLGCSAGRAATPSPGGDVAECASSDALLGTSVIGECPFETHQSIA